MKKLILIVSLALLATLPSRAQTNTNTAPPGILYSIEQAIDSIGAAAPTNFDNLLFGVYAQNSKEFGFGDYFLYNLSQNVGIGVGIECIGSSWFMPSGNVTLHTDIHPLAFLGLTNFTFTPGVDAGIATPIGGTQAEPVASLVGGFVKFDFWQPAAGWKLGFLGGDNHWSGAGTYKGKDMNGNHWFAGLTVSHNL